MRKKWTSRKFLFALVLCVALVMYALLAPGLCSDIRALVLLMACAVNCVWTMCESRVDRAAAPLRIEQESGTQNMHPTDGGAQ